MDYLLRDSYFAGVEYGHFDLDKIIEEDGVDEGSDEGDEDRSDAGVGTEGRRHLPLLSQ